MSKEGARCMTTGVSKRNVEVIAGGYEAFGRGDVDAFLTLVADDCAWEHWEHNTAQEAGVTYLQTQRGPEGVARFFADVARFEIHEFSVVGIWGDGDKVAVEVQIEATAPGGGRFRDEELHVYTFDDGGMIKSMRHYVDTAKHINAARGEESVRQR